MFRYERPQTGRLRQFYQMGLENISQGESCYINDAGKILTYINHSIETIMIADQILNKLLPNQKINLEINSLGMFVWIRLFSIVGSKSIQEVYNKALIEYFSQDSIKSNLSKDSLNRLEKGHPMRILDSKDPSDQNFALDWPKIHDFYDKESEDEFGKLLQTLDSLGVKYERK